jgi:hypothetical protein
MDEFSFLSVLISVILGLAVTEILQGFRGLLLSRTRIQIYWPVIGWAFLVLLVCFEYWWSMFRMRTHHDWTFQQFAIMGLQTTLIYMVAGLVFPDFLGEAIVDLKESFYAHRRWFFSLAVAIIATSVCIGALTRQEWYHKTLVVVTNAAFVLYIVLSHVRMR